MEQKEVMKAAKKALTKALTEGKPKVASEKTTFLEGLKDEIMSLVDKGFSCNQIHGILKESGFIGSYQTVRGVVAGWKDEAGIQTKPKDKKAEKEAAAAAPAKKTPTAKTAKEQGFGEKKDAYTEKLDI